MDKESFKEKIKEEAEIRRIKARDVLLKHRIGGGIVGMIPAVDWVIQKYVVQKDAAKKAGAIFGFDITIYEKKQEIQIQNMGENQMTDQKMNKVLSEPQITLTKKNNNTDDNGIKNKRIKKDTNKPTIKKELLETEEDISNKSEDINNVINDAISEDDKKNKSDSKMKYGRYALSAFTGSVSFTTNAASLLVTSASVALTAATITFSFIGSAVGFGIGSYIMTKHCESLLDKFVELFIENADKLSDSLKFGLKYCRKMASIYRRQKK